jgi:hypothetical protein
MKPMSDGKRGRGMGRTKFCHLLWWQVSDDEQSVEVYSVIQLALFGYPITLSKRGFKLPCHFEETEEVEDE